MVDDDEIGTLVGELLELLFVYATNEVEKTGDEGV